MSYDCSYNLGDEVQSLAAEALLPRVDCRVDRDTGAVHPAPTSERKEIRLLANGWYDGRYCSFPFAERVRPLLISFHINEQDHRSDRSYDIMSAEEKRKNYKPMSSHVEYLRRYAPVGCRDLHTLRVLQRAGVPAYFSGW